MKKNARTLAMTCSVAGFIVSRADPRPSTHFPPMYKAAGTMVLATLTDRVVMILCQASLDGAGLVDSVIAPLVMVYMDTAMSLEATCC
jgi:hypothetical protein